MVSETKVDSQFRQSGGSCVLASYAIVGHYFIGASMTEFFEGYCDHFGLQCNSWQHAEQLYAQHFDAEWKRRNIKGYEVIIDLHNTSRIPIFSSCRSIFSSQFYLSSGPYVKPLENALRTTESFLNITFEVPYHQNTFHSITAFCVSRSLLARDTTKIGTQPLNSLADIGTLHDAVLYMKI